ncbi:MAG TPA: PAS domain-containing protein, partial [Deltaproteobacteria bacterium]|nr:PAS domain-containing protein [Deltaproteobacteria bacterium]
MDREKLHALMRGLVHFGAPHSLAAALRKFFLQWVFSSCLALIFLTTILYVTIQNHSPGLVALITVFLVAVAALLIVLHAYLVNKWFLAPLTDLADDIEAVARRGNMQFTPGMYGFSEIENIANDVQTLCNLALRRQEELKRDAAKSERLLEELRVSEERLALALGGTSDGLWDWRVNERILFLSPSCYTMLGYEPYELPSTYEAWTKLLHPEDQDKVFNEYERWANATNATEFRLRAKDGAWRWIMSRGKVVERDPAGQAERIVGTHVDITERKQAEEALKASQVALQTAMEELEKRVEERTEELSRINDQLNKEIEERKHAEESLRNSEEIFRSLVENINEVIYVVDSTGVITYISPSVEAMLGFEPVQLVGHAYIEFVYPEDTAVFMKHFNQAIYGQIGTQEYRIAHRNGEMRWIQTSSRPVYSNGELVGIQGVMTDITQRKFLSERLILTEKLAATGQLAASVAHEINSPLQAITMMLSDIRNTHKDDATLLEMLDLIKSAFNSIRDTVRNLLDLNRPGMEDKRPCNINEVIEKTVSLVSSYMKQSRVKVELDLNPRLPIILASPQQLGQVFLNLINNAFESIMGLSHPVDGEALGKKGGMIIIRTASDSARITVEIKDNGPGIRPE